MVMVFKNRGLKRFTTGPGFIITVSKFYCALCCCGSSTANSCGSFSTCLSARDHTAIPPCVTSSAIDFGGAVRIYLEALEDIVQGTKLLLVASRFETDDLM